MAHEALTGSGERLAGRYLLLERYGSNEARLRVVGS